MYLHNSIKQPNTAKEDDIGTASGLDKKIVKDDVRIFIFSFFSLIKYIFLNYAKHLILEIETRVFAKVRF